ncbi:MAG: nucleotidyltransferase domain-containing protein [Candidatus Omnitrophica bacterium]|nr:nucleotidyltransferase domain-containing protein [Candidatus Omnitrophota bacterium]
MGTETPEPLVSSALFGKTRQAVLALLYGHDKEPFYLRQIVRAVSLGQGAVQRELARLTAAGLLVRTRRGNQVYYQANRSAAIFPELKSLLVKTAGAADILRAALAPYSDRVQVVLLYGSVAAGTDKSASDIDLLVIGKVSFGEVAEAVSAAQEKLQREINPSVYPPEEFRKKLLAGHHFAKQVFQGPKVFLIGGERELKRLGAKRLADGTQSKPSGDCGSTSSRRPRSCRLPSKRIESRLASEHRLQRRLAVGHCRLLKGRG